MSRRWRINIIVPEEIKTVISVDLNDVSVERALQIVAIKAGALFRRIDNDFILAPADKMPQILESLGKQERFTLKELSPADAIAQLKQAVPLVTARPFGHDLLLIGAPMDLKDAEGLLRQIDVSSLGELTVNASCPIKHLPVADVQQAVSALFPQIKVQKVGDSVVVLAHSAGDLARVQEFIGTIDQAGNQDARYVVYQVKYGSARALAATLQRLTVRVTVVVGPEPYHIPTGTVNLSSSSALSSSSQSGNGGTGSSTLTSGIGDLSTAGSDNSGTGIGANGNSQAGSERATSLIVGGRPADVDAALKLLVSMDTPVAQVVLDVKVVSTNPQTTQSLGIDWSNGGNGQAGSATTTFSELTNGNGVVTGNSTFGRLPISFSTTLNAFFRRDDVNVLAKPTITALNNETGIVFVGETRRIAVANIVPNTGANNVILNNVQEIPVGISLQMRPRVNAGGEITLFLHPVYSTGGAVNATTGLFSTFEREAETTVRVKSGETLVIGGLLQDEDTKTLIKVPLLGDLPLFGQFFRNHSRTHLRREVLVFVTPHLLTD
jgi:type II secretory pathway component GspD/PulD (secretin)